MPDSAGFSGAKCCAREFLLQGTRIQAGAPKESKEKMVHISFTLGFLWNGRAQGHSPTLQEADPSLGMKTRGLKRPEEIVKPCLTASTKK